MQVIQIVPRLPPSVDGVGDYAVGVARELRGAFGLPTRFVVCSDPSTVPASEFDCVRLSRQDGGELRAAILQSAQAGGSGVKAQLVLHYVGYGYSRDGAPEWLVHALESMLAEHPGLALATVFHELFATSMPWRRAFWHSRAQQTLSRRLRACSRHALCTTQGNERILRRWDSSRLLACLPIPSTVREPASAELQPWEERRPALVIFGRPHSRELGYRRPELLQNARLRLGIEEIIDIGPPMTAPAKVPGVAVRALGVVEPEPLSEILAATRYGFLYYPAEFLAKSSIFAAYCAHAMCAIVPAAHVGMPDGLASGHHYLAAPHAGDHVPEMIAREAHRWYAPHRMHAHAAWVADAISQDARNG